MKEQLTKLSLALALSAIGLTGCGPTAEEIAEAHIKAEEANMKAKQLAFDRAACYKYMNDPNYYPTARDNAKPKDPQEFSCRRWRELSGLDVDSNIVPTTPKLEE